MRTIWKFPLVVQDSVEIAMPEGAEVVSVRAITQTALEMWAIVDTGAPREVRVFHVRGTGHDLAGVGEYIDSVSAGMFVWHIFEGL